MSDIDRALRQAHQEVEKTYKILLLGTRDSGKSTLARHITQIYGPKLTDVERQYYRPYVYRDTLRAIKTLSSQLVSLGGLLDMKTIESKVVVDLLDDDDEIDEKLAQHIDTLWQNHQVQSAYTRSGHLRITESCPYFLSRIHQIGAKDYLPTDGDILRISMKRTGIVEHDFIVNQQRFALVDPNGQRNNHNKWLHCFQHITALCFVTSLSAYDEPSSNTDFKTALHESLDLFDRYLKSRWFEKTSIMLFLNKVDIFMDKIKKIALKEYFPEYTGANLSKEASEYIQNLFLEKNSENRMIFPYIVCATDSSNVTRVFEAMKSIILDKNLRDRGLV